MQSTSDLVWAKLAQRAISQYSEIRKESGTRTIVCLLYLSLDQHYNVFYCNLIHLDIDMFIHL